MVLMEDKVCLVLFSVTVWFLTFSAVLGSRLLWYLWQTREIQ